MRQEESVQVCRTRAVPAAHSLRQSQSCSSHPASCHVATPVGEYFRHSEVGKVLIIFSGFGLLDRLSLAVQTDSRHSEPRRGHRQDGSRPSLPAQRPAVCKLPAQAEAALLQATPASHAPAQPQLAQDGGFRHVAA